MESGPASRKRSRRRSRCPMKWGFAPESAKPWAMSVLMDRRIIAPRRRAGEYFAAGFGDADRVLELRRQRPVASDRRPAVAQDLHMRPAEIDHRLDREDHARLEQDALGGPPVMQDVGAIVKSPPKPVTAEVADHRAALGFGIGLDGMADIAGMGAALDRRNPPLETFIGDFHEPLGLSAHFACPVHPARVSVPAIEDKR